MLEVHLAGCCYLGFDLGETRPRNNRSHPTKRLSHRIGGVGGELVVKSRPRAAVQGCCGAAGRPRQIAKEREARWRASWRRQRWLSSLPQLRRER